MFYYEQLFNSALEGIDNTTMIPTILSMAYSILLICFLFGVYQAFARGGDVRQLGVTCVKYLATGLALIGYSTAFLTVNDMFNQLAHFIDQSSGAANMLENWRDQLLTFWEENGNTVAWQLLSNIASSIVTLILIVAGYLLYPITYGLFAFFYMMYGCILYVVGPLVIALYPAMGIGQLARTYLINLMIFNGWGVLYAIFGALITAVNANNVANILGSDSFLGSFAGSSSNQLIGLTSIFYSLGIALIPFIASRIVKGEVGATMLTLIAAAYTAARTAPAAASGAVSGYNRSVEGPGTGGATPKASPAAQPGHYAGFNIAHATGYGVGRTVGAVARKFKR